MLFRITLPRDCGLVPALRQVSERMAQCAGYTSAEAARVGTSVGQAADALMAAHAAASQLDVTIQRNSTHLDIWLRYPLALGDREPAAVDAALSSEALRQGMDSVEFGDEDGIAYCRLRRALPQEKVDHQCAAPPDRP
ncbi:MAG: hypothetical protein ACM3NQ_12745 [Bacteroidales bacterium]